MILIANGTPTARKEHRCSWCGQQIPVGQQYQRQRLIMDGDPQTCRYHSECYDAARESGEGGEWEFEPYVNERPAP